MSTLLLRAQDAAKYLAISKSTFWRWVAEGKLPQGIHLSGRVTVWKRAELDAFVDSMIDSIQKENLAIKVDASISLNEEKEVAAITNVFAQFTEKKAEIPTLALTS